MIRITAFRWVPPFAQGLVRDLRVRWALEEAGIPYETRLIGREDQKSKSYRQQQPFGQRMRLNECALIRSPAYCRLLSFVVFLTPQRAAVEQSAWSVFC